MIATVSNRQREKMHPYKFTLLLAMGSIVMMFAGFTSAYVVKSNQANWLEFKLPSAFWVSTIVILVSSLTIFLAEKAHKARKMDNYRILVTLTALLGLAFVVLQWMGFMQLEANGVKIIGSGSNVSASFLGVITGVHMVHVLGGVVVLLVLFFKAFFGKKKTYSSLPIELAGIYWHFVDILWIYLFVFYSVVSG